MKAFFTRLFGKNSSSSDDPFEAGPGSFGESVTSLINQYQMLVGTNQQRTAVLFDKRANLFSMTAPHTESSRLYTAIRSGEISSSIPSSLTDIVEKAALEKPIFFRDLLRLVARVEYGVRAGQPAFHAIYQHIDNQLTLNAIVVD